MLVKAARSKPIGNTAALTVKYSMLVAQLLAMLTKRRAASQPLPLIFLARTECMDLVSYFHPTVLAKTE